MTPEEFRALLDTYGADLIRWPHARRQDAQRLLQESEDARNAFADAQAFDALLATAEPPLTEARRRRLTDAILDNLPDDPAPAPVSAHPRAAGPAPGRRAVGGGIGVLVRPLTGLWVACLAFGILIGAAGYLAQRSAVVHSVGDWSVTLDIYGLK